MSKEDVKRVKRRLEKAKQEMAWMFAVLRDQDEALQGYHLSEAEKESITQEILETMTKLILPLAQQLARHPLAPIQSATLEQMESLHFTDYDFSNVVSSEDVVNVEVLGRGEQLRRVSSTDIDIESATGDVTISHRETIAGGASATTGGGLSIIDLRSDVVSTGGGTRHGNDDDEDI
ncbi:MAG TPA: hypothetical protein VJ761_10980 [Ktedonobacteraceae bacterium]|nr:hypothetical protein [Ktedonobacteraceae bacterium]